MLIVGWAYDKYAKGEGGFRLGVDLSGGTILVYEVDETKMTDQARRPSSRKTWPPSLKRRIDPADLYNVTIRPVPGDPPRVEIILPTGGRSRPAAERGLGQAARRGVQEVSAAAGGRAPTRTCRRARSTS